LVINIQILKDTELKNVHFYKIFGEKDDEICHRSNKLDWEIRGGRCTVAKYYNDMPFEFKRLQFCSKAQRVS
jgi:hypothetical protein